MSIVTHNLGNNATGQMIFAKCGEGGMQLSAIGLAGKVTIYLTEQQKRELKELLA